MNSSSFDKKHSKNMAHYGSMLTALEFLKENQSCRIGDLRLSVDGNGVLNVTGWSNYIHLENITKVIALNELNEIRSLFNEMVLASGDLGIFVSNKKIRFNLDYDYGKGSIGICSLLDNLITWENEIK